MIYDFIQSQSVINYLQNINYKFTPLEQAYLVFHSHRPLFYKVKYYENLIAETADFAIDGEDFTFHTLLGRLTDLYAQLQKKFEEESGYWTSSVYISYNERYECAPCTRLNDILGEAAQRIRNESFARILVTKRYVDDKDCAISLKFDGNLRLVDVSVAGVNEQDKVFLNFFHDIFFVFPTPFKCGDVVNYRDGVRKKTGVLEEIPCQKLQFGKMYRRQVGKMLPHNGANLYEIKKGTICSEFLSADASYLDLEYCTDNKSELEQTLSDYLQERQDLASLLNCYTFSMKQYLYKKTRFL